MLTIVHAPEVIVSSDVTGTHYAGSKLTLNCTIILSQVLVDAGVVNDVTVTSSWYGPSGEIFPTGDCEDERVCASGLEQLVDIAYSSTVMFDTLRTSDSGNYNCTATVSIADNPFVTDGSGTIVRTTSVESKLLIINI